MFNNYSVLLSLVLKPSSLQLYLRSLWVSYCHHCLAFIKVTWRECTHLSICWKHHMAVNLQH